MKFRSNMSSTLFENSKIFERYRDLLNVIDFDFIRAVCEYRTSKDLYDSRKTIDPDNRSSFITEDADLAVRVELFANYPEIVEYKKMSEIQLGDARNRRSTAVSLLKRYLEAALSDRCKIDIRTDDHRMYYITEDDEIKQIENFSIESFARFLQVLLDPLYSDKEIYQALTESIAFLNADSAKSHIIQFNDCYVERGHFEKGFAKSGLARFYIDRNVWHVIEDPNSLKKVKAVDDLIDNLCAYDEETKSRFLAIFSTVFLNDPKFKKKYNYSPRLVGKDGENGKSLFKDLIEEAFGSTNVSHCNFQSLSDRGSKLAVANSLIAIDGDSSGSIISEDSASVFKNLTSGDSFQARGLYKEEITVIPVCLMLAFSNMLPASSDKSAAYLRRLQIIKSDYQLKTSNLGPNSLSARFEIDEEFFRTLRSERAAQYLIELLIVESQRLLGSRRLPKESEMMKKAVSQYAEDSNSAAMFVYDVGIDEIIGYQVSEVRKKYEAWCELNDVTVLKRKFNEILESQFAIVAKMVRHSHINQLSDYYAKSFHEGKPVRCWQYSDEIKNRQYFDKLNP